MKENQGSGRASIARHPSSFSVLGHPCNGPGSEAGWILISAHLMFMIIVSFALITTLYYYPWWYVLFLNQASMERLYKLYNTTTRIPEMPCIARKCSSCFLLLLFYICATATSATLLDGAHIVHTIPYFYIFQCLKIDSQIVHSIWSSQSGTEDAIGSPWNKTFSHRVYLHLTLY